MAAFEDQGNLAGKASIKFTYDDVEMKLVSIGIQNDSEKDVIINITSPITWSRTINPTKGLFVALPAVSRPTYYMTDHSANKGVGAKAVDGIAWSFRGVN